MKEVLIGDSKHRYHYESFPNDINARNAKWNQLKKMGYKKITIGQYTSGDGRTIYYLAWE